MLPLVLLKTYLFLSIDLHESAMKYFTAHIYLSVAIAALVKPITISIRFVRERIALLNVILRYVSLHNIYCGIGYNTGMN